MSSEVNSPKRVANEGIRLHVFLAHQSIGSRRQCEEYIQEGLVKVNGTVVDALGTKVTSEDEVQFRGKKVSWKEAKKVYIALYKPEKYICSHQDAEDRPLAVNLVQPFFTERLFYVGRLDYMTSGLLLLTNDGDFSDKLMHPSFEVEKEYEVKTAREIPEELLERFKRGMWVNGERYQLKSYRTRGSREANLVLTEGKNQEIRQVFLSANITIKRVHRIRIGSLTLRGLSPGQFRKLTKKEVGDLLSETTPKKVRIYKSKNQESVKVTALPEEVKSVETENWVETTEIVDPSLLSKKRKEKPSKKDSGFLFEGSEDSSTENPVENSGDHEHSRRDARRDKYNALKEEEDGEDSFNKISPEDSDSPEIDGERESFSRDRDSSRGERGGFGSRDRDSRPPRSFGDRDSSRGERGGFGSRDRDSRPPRSFGDRDSSRGERGGFGSRDRDSRPPRSFGDRDSSRGERGGFGSRDRDSRPPRSFGDRDSSRGERGGFGSRDRDSRPPRSFGDRDSSRGERGGFGSRDRDSRPPRSFGDRDSSRGERGGFGSRDRDSRPPRSFGDRDSSRGERGGFGSRDRDSRPPRSFGDRDSSRGERGGFGSRDRDSRPPRSFGDRDSSRGERGGFGSRDRDSRPPRSFGDRDSSRGERGGFGSRDRDSRPPRSFGDRDSSRGERGGFGSRDRDSRPPRSFGDRDSSRGERGGFGSRGSSGREGFRKDSSSFKGGPRGRDDRRSSGRR